MPVSNTPDGFCEDFLERTKQAVFSFDITLNQITYLNPAFEQVFRKARTQEIKPAALLQMVHPEDQPYLQQKYQELLEGIILQDVEFRILLPDKTVRWVCLTPFLVEKAGQQIILGFAEDFSATREMSNYLRKFSDKKNAVLNILSHDLAGPLAMIQSLSGLLAEELNGQENEEISKLIDLISKTSKQGTQLIQEFIAQEFLESANTDLAKQRIDIVGMTRTVMKQYQETERQTKKDFRFVASGESIFLEVDENKFMQVINNLVSNAIKFTPDGGIITVSIEEQPDAVLFTVADDGVGIPEKYHATLFDKFTKARRPGIKGEPSVGLGMSIIKTIVEWHNGSIWFESEVNEGTTFYISLPRSASALPSDN